MSRPILRTQTAITLGKEGGDATCVAVTAKEHPKTRPEIFADVEEGLDYTLEFSNGAKAELVTTYADRIGKFRAEGDKGWIALEPAHSYQGIQAVTSQGPLKVRQIESQQALQMDDFALCVRDKRESIVGGAMGEREHIQRIGRILRPMVGKKATLFELICRNTMETRQWKKRSSRIAARITA